MVNQYLKIGNMIKHEDLVYCGAWHGNKKWKEVEIASDFSVYPCCLLNATHQLNDTYFDKKLEIIG